MIAFGGASFMATALRHSALANDSGNLFGVFLGVILLVIAVFLVFYYIAPL